MELTELQRKTLDIVTLRLSANPITGTEIANKIGLKPRSTGKEGADMRSVIHALRVKGYPICATGSGYWWPKDGDELRAYMASLEGRINDQQEALDGLRKGYMLVGEAKAAEAVKASETVVFSAKKGDKDTIFLIPVNRIDEFLAKYPDAVRQ